MSQEQRKFPRISEAFQLSCRRHGALSETWHSVVTVDLSAGGIHFQGEEWYEPDEPVHLRIMLPGSGNPLVLKGRVVRSREWRSGAVECAVEFVEVLPDQTARLDELVEFLRQRPSPSA